MPSVRIKKGYYNIDDGALQAGPSRSFSAATRAPSDDSQGFEMVAPPARKRAWSSLDSTSHTAQPSRPCAPSKVSNHIMSSMRQVPRLSGSSAQDAPFAGPSHHGQTNTNTSRSHHLSRHYPDSYSVDGQQAELRVPNDSYHDLSGSQVNLALRQLEDGQFDRADSLEEHHHDDIVEHLDVIDPQISTVSTLTNAANAIVVPPLSFYSRKPVVMLPRLHKKKKKEDVEKGLPSVNENVSEDALDQHVEDVLRKRDKFRRAMQGVWSFLKTPLGIVTAIYGFLVVFWGTGIVFFLAKFINLHNDIQQGFWVELCQQVETGLFTVTSIGFIPFRIMDSYRICKIWLYKRKIARTRKRAGLLKLYDPDDLPDPVYDKNYVQVLTEKEQIDLHYQQHQFMKSQTWYRPHGTQTHRAFPINTALWICVCNDLNSVFQCLLSGTMWGLDRFQRPAWTTATSLPAAFIAGIAAGVLIYLGSRKTRRTKQVEDRLRIALEMEHEASGAKRSDSNTPTTVVEEGGATPKALLNAESSSKPSSSMTPEGNLTPTPMDCDSSATTTAQDTETITPCRRKRSDVSLRFADEMVVPPTEDLQRNPFSSSRRY